MKKLLIAILMTAHSAFAQDCAPMNLVTEENSPFKKIPVYDQDGIGICYAYVAAQLVDYHLVKSGKDRSVHPLWAALKYADTQKQDKISSGVTYNSISEIKSKGNCSYDKITGSISEWATKANVKDVDVIDLIERLAPKLKNLYNAKTMLDPKAIVSEAEIDVVIKEAIKDHEPWCSPGATWEALMPELRSISIFSSKKILSELVLPECKDSLDSVNIPHPVYTDSHTDSVWVPHMQRKLSSLKAPISVSYCSRVLKEPDFDGVERKTAKTPETFADNCGGHESLIVGKKMIGESCHFLLRNSWGNGFSASTQKWKCLCKHRTTGEMVDDCTNETHNNGEYTVEGCWINGNQLSKNIFGMTSLENIPRPKQLLVPGKQKKGLTK